MANNTLLHRFACLTSGAAFSLLIAGGLVTSTESGLAVPDWPLSYGRFFPPMVGGIFFEHGHRMIAGIVGLMSLVLTAWVWLSPSRRWVRWLAVAAAFGIVLQAVLGGLTVLFGLPPQISIAHACLGQGVFCLLVALAEVTSSWRIQPTYSSGRGSWWTLGLLVAGLAYLQLILGAILRHTGDGLAYHVIGALLVSVAICRLAYGVITQDRSESIFTRPVYFLMALWPLQFLLGAGSLIVVSKPVLQSAFWQAALPTAHLTCGALILGTAVLWTMRAHHVR